MNKLFVYGTLKQGHGNHRLLTDAKFVGTATTSQEFTMYSTGGFPALVHSGDTSIFGEVYEVTDEEFSRLDVLEGYPHMYTREQISVNVGEEGDSFVSNNVWVYIWNYELDDMPVVESGEW